MYWLLSPTGEVVNFRSSDRLSVREDLAQSAGDAAALARATDLGVTDRTTVYITSGDLLSFTELV